MVSGETISKAARKAGVGVETIRFYERKGLIEQPRHGLRVLDHVGGPIGPRTVVLHESVEELDQMLVG